MRANSSRFPSRALVRGHGRAISPAMRCTLILSAPFILGPCLASCATATDTYPSLAIRDVERAQGQFDPIPAKPLAIPEVLTPGTGSLSDRLAALAASAAISHKSFLANAPIATRLANAAGASAIGSDVWASAQVALADLDSARSSTAIALADLDTLMVASAVQAEDVSAIELIRQQVLRQIGVEDETLARLRAKVR